MLIRSKTKTLIDSLFCSAAKTQFVRSTIFSANRYYIAQDSDSQIFDKFLQSQENTIKFYSGGDFKFDRVAVPRQIPNVRQIHEKLKTQWKNKKLVFNIDGSRLIGSRRMFMKNHLQRNVYQGVSSPDALFSELNPSIQLAVQQVKFDLNTFFCSDPVAVQAVEKNKDLPEQKLDGILQDVLATTYENQPQRFGNRLKSILAVPEPYLKLIQLAVYNENQIFFCGINEYCFRNLLSKYLSLQQVRQMFMMSMKFAQSQSYKFKISQGSLLANRKLNLEDRYQSYSRELLYLNFYGLIKKVQNGQILKRVNSISKLRDGQGRRAVRPSIKKNNEVKVQSNIVFVGHDYTVQTLREHLKVENLQQFTQSARNPWIIQPKSMYTAAPLEKQKVAKSTENDAQKIEKHAILQVMLGDLWNQPFTFNKFPYLSENYNKLSEEDKKYVKKLYHDNVVKFTAAKRVFYKTNIRKIQELNAESAQYANLRIDYQERRKQYEKLQQSMRKKQEQIQQLCQNRSKAERLNDHYQQYKSNYEEDPSKLQSLKQEADRQLKIKQAAEALKEMTGKNDIQVEQVPRKRRTRPSRRANQNQTKQENPGN